MSIQSLSALLAAIVTCAIGWSVILRDRRRRSYLTFSILSFNLCLWNLASFFATTFASSALFWFSLLFALGIPTTAELFFRAFLAQDPRLPGSLNRVTMVISGIFYLLLFYAGLAYPLHQSRTFQIPVFIFIFTSLYHCIYLIYVRRSSSARTEATRFTYILYGGAAAVTLAATDFLPTVGVVFPTVGNILTVIYMYFISQTLFHYRLLDIKELLGKMVTLSVLVLILALFYGLLLAWVDRDRPGVFFFNTLVASFVIMVIFEQLRTWVEDRINRWMFREKYEFARGLRMWRFDLANIIDVPTLTTHLLRHLEESERMTHASIYLADATGAYYRLAGYLGPQPIDHLESTTRLHFLERLKESGMLTQESLERDLEHQLAENQEDAAVVTRNMLNTLEDLSAGVCIPMSMENQLLGMLNLHDDRLREAYGSEELEALRKLAAQTAITLSNSQVYEQMKERDRLAALGQMAAGLAHEIRNPLGAIKGAAQLLKTSPEAHHPPQPSTSDPSESEEYMEIIIEEVNRLDRVVSQFLGYAHPDRGQRETLSINDIVHKTVPLLTSQAEEAEIQTELGMDLPPVRVDPEQMRQVLLNLGINALQAMEGRGTLTISTRARREPKQGSLTSVVEIIFKDTGKGISPEELPDIFIPFFTTKESGTGLGLPICQRIVENHRGRIEVRSHPGKGSTFSVILPMAGDVTGTHTLS